MLVQIQGIVVISVIVEMRNPSKRLKDLVLDELQIKIQNEI